MTHLADLIPELPRTFDVVEGELVQGGSMLAVQVVLLADSGAARGLEVHTLPVRSIVEVDGRPVYVGWVSAVGWPGPKVAAWAV